VIPKSPVRQRKFEPVSPITRTVPLSPLKPPDHEPSDHAFTDHKPTDHKPLHDDQEIHELRAKIRVLETKRTDDTRHIRELESRLAEAESFVAIRPKLQAKLNSQQTDLIATRRELADAQQLSQVTETKLLEAQEQLEMAMLDKEVAEEKAEMAETELLELKEKFAVAEVEIGVLKDGGQHFAVLFLVSLPVTSK
jgi:dynactin 1